MIDAEIQVEGIEVGDSTGEGNSAAVGQGEFQIIQRNFLVDEGE